MDWRDKAACLTADPELFFPVGNTGPAVDQIDKAKAVCARCTVTEMCLQYALETSQDFLTTERYLVALVFVHIRGGTRAGLRTPRAAPPAARVWRSLKASALRAISGPAPSWSGWAW